MYYGLTSIAIQLFSFYVVSISVWIQLLLGIVVMVVLFFLAGKEERTENNGVLSYGQALITTFLTGFTGVLISTLFMIILIQLVDPGLVEKLTQMSVDAAKSVMESFGMPEDQMAAALEKAEEDAANSFTPLNQLLQILWGSIMILIVAAIVSIFIKKDEDPTKISIDDMGNS